jgi:uncharacterized membrane protein
MTATPEAVTFSPENTQAVPIRSVAFDAPWNWLGAGWRDLWSAPATSLAYGGAFAALAYAFVLHLARIDALPLLLPLAGGFLLIGPVLAAGLYEVSRQREGNRSASFRDILCAARRSGGQLASFGVLLLLLYFFWMQIASLLFMLFFGNADFPPIENFIPTLLFTPHGLGLLVTGTAAGAVLACVAFAISAISVPMMLDKKIGVVTAVKASVEAVRLNRPAMLLWAALILGISALGFAALFAGLAIAFPLIGHATWHAYRELTGTLP